MNIIGKSPNRVDAYDKVTGKAKYTPPIWSLPMPFMQKYCIVPLQMDG